MPIEINDIIAKMEWTCERGLSKFVWNSSGATIQIRRDATPTAIRTVATAEEATNLQENTANTIDAPMAGICHLSAENGSDPFVSVGDVIEVGQTICLVEAMKVMTSITAMIAGTVKTILVEDGVTVDAGAALVEVSA